MNNFKSHGNEINLEGSLIKVGDTLSFSATKTDFSNFDFSGVSGKKVISVFPSINTSVCDEQTREIVDLAQKHKDVTFISISLDLPTTQSAWCSANGIDNIIIVSDYKKREFGKKTGLLIEEIKLLYRAIITLDENNVVTSLIFDNELTNMPDFSKLKAQLG